jgi:hypothetical protein
VISCGGSGSEPSTPAIKPPDVVTTNTIASGSFHAKINKYDFSIENLHSETFI